MSKNKNILGLIMSLTRRPMTMEAIALRLEVSHRTAKRYIQDLTISPIPLIKDQAGHLVRYRVALRAQPTGALAQINASWRSLTMQYGGRGKKSVIVMCEACKVGATLTPIPAHRPDCKLCVRPLVIDCFI